MAGFDDISKKAQAFLKDGKVQEALKSEKAEGVSDSVLDAVAKAADKATGGKHSDKIEQARRQADEKLGDR
ncbi:Rv0909 family putative TA system antitoxin [Frigoribacterium sp. CFBP9039]|uniref:Rv0909 family putative TA system antitoxin n=1 Tax=Frigoribacterium TaxID=96492 RepID=UPI0017813142|nr:MULTISPECIES: Rv0909 family putative TA system antitoxin [Frigoribacterium]MBD8704162.1 antitoxin [Frigoribacterium sp. CFBP 13712]MCJ0700384.1 antitoxin [Frigoribacterium faeni]MDY0892568.1 Rv0909 family putative TA system antitoxin [Frigoribacterium sp. CFBP9030]MDY0945423.1 Rv0909 family putative TA system antitoxin [Frigoribacterium sp. CFBP9039]